MSLFDLLRSDDPRVVFLGIDGVPYDLVMDHPDVFENLHAIAKEGSTEKTTAEPAWLQDLEETSERAGRAQDKEELMQRLRDLGYM